MFFKKILPALFSRFTETGTGAGTWRIRKAGVLANKKTAIPSDRNHSATLQLTETGEEGFEPPLTVLETVALPLNYSPTYLCMYLQNHIL